MATWVKHTFSTSTLQTTLLKEDMAKGGQDFHLGLTEFALDITRFTVCVYSGHSEKVQHRVGTYVLLDNIVQRMSCR